ncbi:hypothetical protein, partial [Flavobacterium sp. A45]|uniref:hypothetical protein n=1 Tax=Flavobacterium sp. A45 TaxID=1945862 RepID=UPI0009CB5EB3
DNVERFLLWLEAYLVLYYNNYLNQYNRRNRIYEIDPESRKNKLLINSFINQQKNNEFLDIFEHIDRRGNSGNLDFEHFLKRIDLIESIVE